MQFLRSCALGALAAYLFVGSAIVHASGVDTANPQLPPDMGAYLTPAGVHATYHGPGLTLVLSQIAHKPFAATTVRTPMGPNEVENFQSAMDGMIAVNGGPNLPTSSNGPVTTEVFGKIGNITGTFQTEMLSMSLTGVSPLPYMVRESPTLATLGQTSITPIGGGLFHIDSFFDVFTELSLDGGQSWIPSDSSTHVVLEPEPASAGLIALVGFAGLTRRRGR